MWLEFRRLLLRSEPAVAEPGCVVTPSLLAAAGVTVKAVASARVRAPSVKRSVFASEASSRRSEERRVGKARGAGGRGAWSGPVPEPSETVMVVVTQVTV